MTTSSPYRSADSLGNIVSEHSVAGLQQVGRIALGLFCLLVAVDCVWLGMWPRFGEIHWGAFVVTGIIALVFFWLSFDAFSQYIKARRQRVTCHEYGLRIHDLELHQDVRFDDITSVGSVLWQAPEGVSPGGAVMWLDDVQGRRIELPSPLAQPHELGQTIRSMTFEKRRSGALSCIANGEEARFGSIALGSLVLIVNGEVLPRSALETVKISSRFLAIKAYGQRERLLPTEEIVNLDVLLALIQR